MRTKSCFGQGIFTLLALVLSVPCLFGQAADPVVAEVDGQQVTLSELERSMADKLFQARRQYYAVERAALEQWIDDQILANEARRQHISVEQLLDRNVNQHVTDPTEDQLRVYYEGINTDQPFESIRDKVLQHIRELRAAKIRAAYIKSLREQAGVLITFDAPSVALSAENSRLLGSQSAPIRLVEFADFQCPYCQQSYDEVKRLLEHYGAKVSFSFRDFPLPMHPQAPKAAEAARCAAAQGKFFDYYNALFTDKKLAVPELKEEAKKLSLDASAFDKCLDSGEQASAVQRDASEAQRLGISGTPTFFINGHLYDGPAKYEAFRDAIDKELVGLTGKGAKDTAALPSSR